MYNFFSRDKLKGKTMLWVFAKLSFRKNKLSKKFIKLFCRSCRTDKVDMKSVRLLLTLGADINATDSNGYTALFYSAIAPDVASFKFLLEKGASINLTYGELKENILHVLARRQSMMLEVLCDEYDVSGIINNRDERGMTALDIIKEDRYCGEDIRKRLVSVLERNGGKQIADILKDELGKSKGSILLDYSYSEKVDLDKTVGMQK